MREMGPIVKFEFIRVIKKKWFIIGTILTPLLIGFYALFPVIAKGALKKERKLVVYDSTGAVYEKFKSYMEKQRKEGLKFLVEEINSVGKGKELMEKKQADGFLFIPEDVFEKKEATLYLKNVADFVMRATVSQTLAKCVNEKLFKEVGIPESKLKELMKEVKLKTLKIEKGKVKKGAFESVFFSYLIFAMLIFMGLIGYGNILLRRVLEDKTSRVVEIIYSSATPYQLFAGKLVGVGLAGILQVGIWMVLGLLGFIYVLTYVPQVDLSGIFSNFFLFLVFFISGFFLYSSIFLTVGAITNSEEEAQHMLSPIMFTITLPFALSFMLMQSPESFLSKFFSFFPYTAPFFMLLRSTISTPPLIEIAISVALVVLTSAISIWASAKIFRVGMLYGGKPASLKEVFRWIREAK